MELNGKEELKGPVLHIVVVGFHHKKGCQVEYSYPPLIPEEGHDSNNLPEEWKYLPFLALPDGAHNYQEDTVFFHLPPLAGTDMKCVYGVSCYRQIEAKSLKVRLADVTRETVQKSVCVLSQVPLYGLLQAKLQLITHAYFEEKDFSQISILKELYEHMNSSLRGTALEGSQVFLGMSPRDLILHFRHKVLFYVSPVNRLVGALMTVLSLFPGMIEHGLADSSHYRPKSSEDITIGDCVSGAEEELVSVSVTDVTNATVELMGEEGFGEDHTTSTVKASQRTSPSPETCTPARENTQLKPPSRTSPDSSESDWETLDPSVLEEGTRDSETGGSGALEHPETGIPITVQPRGLSAGTGGQGAVSQGLSAGTGGQGAVSQGLSAGSGGQGAVSQGLSAGPGGQGAVSQGLSAGPGGQGAVSQGLSAGPGGQGAVSQGLSAGPGGQGAVSQGLVSGLEEDQYGLPLAIFTKGYLCLPYMALQQHHLLSDVTVRGFVAGATNILFRQQRHLSDAIVDVEEAKLQIGDPELRKLLALTTADLRFADYLVKHVTENREDVFLDGTGWEGGDEWIRAQFGLYIHSLLSSTLLEDNEKLLADWGAPFISAWRITHNYRVWFINKHPAMAEITPGHPFQGQYSAADLKLRFSHSVQNSERGKKMGAAVITTSRSVVQTGKAVGQSVGGALSSAKSAMSSWFSTLAPPAIVPTPAASPEPQLPTETKP
ncbi:late secretory pathway protein AVL9 homolog isoform X2 [Salvelinus namaycush]|uniref:Late secretory pathway protein AVL9 homolog isoform X2 n=1 Tax=Salvelinus namaycush TaxID=8040 RepID=A0A8U0TU15_SALNM|nr:late secretory pathway protein AVL9 homolog isoform X2 [Salvelinus namaycush]